MKIETIHTEAQLNIVLEGDMDAAGCKQIRPIFDNIAETAKQAEIRLDMQSVNFLDSSGIGAIVFLYKRIVAQGGKVSLDSVHGQPLELMELLRISSVIPVNNNVVTS